MSEQGLLTQMMAMKKMMMCSDGSLMMTTTIEQTLEHYNMRLTLKLNEAES
jgi:hypothetical protein